MNENDGRNEYIDLAIFYNEEESFVRRSSTEV